MGDGDSKAQANELAVHVQQQWTKAFNAGDVAAIEALYTPDALLFGGKPDLYAGPGGVKSYFSVLAPGATAAFGATTVTRASPEVILTAGQVLFRRDGVDRPHRMSWTLVALSTQWLIASHHASPRPASP